jgi:hypothetical protein
MNDRIKEIVSQAYEQKPLMVPNPDTFEIEHKIGNGGRLMYTKEFNQEKFAELIVKECVQVCLSQRDPSNLNYKPSERFAEAVKQHFGVF